MYVKRELINISDNISEDSQNEDSKTEESQNESKHKMLRMRIDDSKNQDYEIYKIVKSHCCIAGPSSKCLLKKWLLVVHDPEFFACASLTSLLKKLRDNF